MSTLKVGLNGDIDEITRKDPGYKAYFLFDTILHTTEKDLDFTNGVFIAALEEKRDFVEQTTPIIELQLFVKQGTFAYDVYPFAEDLEVTLIKYRQSRDGLEANESRIIYNGVFVIDKNQDLPKDILGTREELDKQPPVVLTLSLVDQGALAVRNKQTSGIVNSVVSDVNRDMRGSSILKSLLTNFSKNILVNNKPAIEKVMIEDSPNQTPLENLTIPTGTGALDVTNYIQEHGGGLYNAGSNNFIQWYSDVAETESARTMFVYSMYNGDKYYDAENKAMFFVPSDGTLQNVLKCTYKYMAKTLKIVTNSVDGLHSTKDSILKSEGDGFRSASSEAMMSTAINPTKDGPYFKKTGILSEVANKLRRDGSSLIPYKGITNNHFVDASEVLSKKGQYIILPVDHLDMDYVAPAMGCEIFYELPNGYVTSLIGVIHSIDIKYNYTKLDFGMEQTKNTHALMCKAFFTVYITGPEVDEDASADNFF